MLTASELAAALSAPGLIREDVLDTVANLDEDIPLTFTNTVGTGPACSSVYTEWTENDLNPIDINNAVIEGAASTGNDTKIGQRLGNHTQLSDKEVSISTTSEAVTSIGAMGTMAYQRARRLMDLRRDIEAISMGRQASVQGVAGTTAGRAGGFSAYISTNYYAGATGSAGGFNTATKVVDAPTDGTKRALTWTMVRTAIRDVYVGGGNPSVLHTVPDVIQEVNSFLFSDAGKPYRAEPTANVQGSSPASQTAQGYISVVLSDFNIRLSLVDNRLMQTYSDSQADVQIFDPRYVEHAFLQGYRIRELGVKGHSDEALIAAEWTLRVKREDAHACIADIDITAPVTA